MTPTAARRSVASLITSSVMASTRDSSMSMVYPPPTVWVILSIKYLPERRPIPTTVTHWLATRSGRPMMVRDRVVAPWLALATAAVILRSASALLSALPDCFRIRVPVPTVTLISSSVFGSV